HASRQTDRLDAVDAADRRQELDDALGGCREGIAAADDQIADLWVLSQVVERGPQPRKAPSATAAADHAAARAEAAIHAAAIGHQKQRPIRVALDQLRGDLVRLF